MKFCNLCFRYALKRIRNTWLSDEDFDEINKEISIHIKIQNEFIIEYIDHFFESNYPCIVTAFYKVSSNFFKQFIYFNITFNYVNEIKIVSTLIKL